MHSVETHRKMDFKTLARMHLYLMTQLTDTTQIARHNNTKCTRAVAKTNLTPSQAPRPLTVFHHVPVLSGHVHLVITPDQKCMKPHHNEQNATTSSCAQGNLTTHQKCTTTCIDMAPQKNSSVLTRHSASTTNSTSSTRTTPSTPMTLTTNTTMTRTTFQTKYTDNIATDNDDIPEMKKRRGNTKTNHMAKRRQPQCNCTLRQHKVKSNTSPKNAQQWQIRKTAHSTTTTTKQMQMKSNLGMHRTDET